MMANMMEKGITLKSNKTKKKEVSKMRGKILIVMVVAIALLGAGVALAGISTTKHNLSASGSGTIKASAGQQNDQICVYCHTPHFAVTAGAPLWNKVVQSTTYTMYGITLAGTTPDTAPNGITKACLSCHDGVNAINSIVNQAGAGGVVTGGTNVAFNTTNAGTALTMPAGATNLGTNLADDHPVSIIYTAGKAGLVATTTSLTGWEGATTVANLLKGASNNKVECSSCHDPHTSTNGLFLRKANTGSALCLGCHAK